MKKTSFTLLITIMLIVAVTSIGWQRQPVFAIHPGFFKSEQFMQMPEAQQEGYAAGLVDGIYVSPLVGSSEEKVESLHKCIAGMSTTQVAAIIEKFLKDNPEKWHQPLNVEAFNAVNLACRNN